ncbi:hypothetical protein QE152_g37942 [Popillia japonica]|uniref:BRCT domain-containing protein n=1 Tax=Popillia japonica TaxID=7064 RepID=A0AAW1I9A8_POPJA
MLEDEEEGTIGEDFSDDVGIDVKLKAVVLFLGEEWQRVRPELLNTSWKPIWCSDLTTTEEEDVDLVVNNEQTEEDHNEDDLPLSTFLPSNKMNVSNELTEIKEMFVKIGGTVSDQEMFVKIGGTVSDQGIEEWVKGENEDGIFLTEEEIIEVISDIPN